MKKKAEAKFCAGGSWVSEEAISESVAVRASSYTEDWSSTKPLQPLNRDVDRVAFLYAWMQAKQKYETEKSDEAKSALKTFSVHARSFKVPSPAPRIGMWPQLFLFFFSRFGSSTCPTMRWPRERNGS